MGWAASYPQVSGIGIAGWSVSQQSESHENPQNPGNSDRY